MLRMSNCIAVLLSALSVAALAPACTTSSTSTKGQQITCATDPNSEIIVECAPGTEVPGGSSANSCRDIDEDGDGEPHDDDSTESEPSNGLAFTAHTSGRGGSDDPAGDDSAGNAADSDDDGIPDAEDCDERRGEDDDESADLPYDIRPQLGATTTPILDAFASKGAAPAAITSVVMEGGSWRLAELQAGTPFVVTQADCEHPGNRDVGRDRVFVTWTNTTGGTSETDHLDIRYCK